MADSPIAPTAIEEGEMMMPDTLCLSVRHFNCTGRMQWLSYMGKQPLTSDSLVPIMLKSADGWDHVAAFVALTMRRKMEIAWECQRQPIAATTQHPMPDLAIPPPVFVMGGCNDYPTRDGWTASYIRQFGPDYAEKHRRMGPSGRFDDASQDGDSMGVAEAAHSCRQPAPNAGPRYPPIPCLSLATQQQNRKTIQAGLTRRHLLAAKIPAKHRILNKGRV